MRLHITASNQGSIVISHTNKRFNMDQNEIDYCSACRFPTVQLNLIDRPSRQSSNQVPIAIEVLPYKSHENFIVIYCFIEISVQGLKNHVFNESF